jgi:hypothetical protein
MTKGKAFGLCLLAVMVIFLCVFLLVALKGGELSIIPVTACLTAVVTVTTAYMGIQTANNGVKGKYWNQDMYDSENQKPPADKTEGSGDGKKC